MERVQNYDKKADWTYCFGPYPSWHVLERAPERVLELLYDPAFHDLERLLDFCQERHLPCREAARALERISAKKDTYVALRLSKQEAAFLPAGPQVLLENVRDMGNLGTILRTMAAFDYRALALVGETCDFYNPKVLRASMGSFIDIQVEFFKDIDAYAEKYPNQALFAFALSPASRPLASLSTSTLQERYGRCWTAAFGNEGAGLTAALVARAREVVMIEQSPLVDSLNLPIACALGLYQLRGAQRSNEEKEVAG